MILRFYKTILIGKKRRLLIEFKENKYQILSTFLESDVSPFEEWIKSDFDRVISGESEYEEVNGNVCCAEISPKTTKVYDIWQRMLWGIGVKLIQKNFVN